MSAKQHKPRAEAPQFGTRNGSIFRRSHSLAQPGTRLPDSPRSIEISISIAAKKSAMKFASLHSFGRISYRISRRFFGESNGDDGNSLYGNFDDHIPKPLRHPQIRQTSRGVEGCCPLRRLISVDDEDKSHLPTFEHFFRSVARLL